MKEYLIKNFGEEFLTAFGRRILENKTFNILCHVRPDLDSVGSSLAFYFFLKALGKDVNIYNIEIDNKHFQKLEGYEFVKSLDENTPRDFENDSIVILLDTGDTYESYFPTWGQIFSDKNIKVWNIDHHMDNKKYGDINLVDGNVSACAILIIMLFDFFDILWDERISMNLFIATMSDTGWLTHGVNPFITYKVMACLFSKGFINLDKLRKQFQSFEYNKLILWGKVLQRIDKTKAGGVISYAKQSDLDETKCTDEDLSGDLVNTYIAGCKGSKYGFFVKDKSDEKLEQKISIRTVREDVNVQKIASQFGGGGHVKASGFTIRDKSFLETVELLKDKF